MAAVRKMEEKGARRLTFKVTAEDVEELEWYLASAFGLGA